MTLPNIEERFLPPANWQIKNFNNPETGHDIYYRTALVDNAKATIICLPGLSEYGEKYIETSRFFNKNDYSFITIDWAYQGFSTRFKGNPHKRHSDGYETDLSDLHYLITNEVNHNLPLYMLGHSMGGHIGMRYLSEHQNMFKAASFSAPMLNIKTMKYISRFAKCAFSSLKILHDKYVIGGSDWHERKMEFMVKNIFTHDPIRAQVHNAWSISTPDLQIGSTTYKWVCESLKSIHILKEKSTLQKISCPILIAIAGQEKLVDNTATKKAARNILNAKLIKLENARHEILMETNDIRDRFLKETLKIFN